MWKYIILLVGNREVPIIFPSDLVHSVMLDAMRLYYCNIASTMANGALSEDALQSLHDSIVAVSAGELRLDVGGVGGGSETLGVKSRGRDDHVLIQSHPYTHGILPEHKVQTEVRPCGHVSNTVTHGRLTCELPQGHSGQHRWYGGNPGQGTYIGWGG